MAITLTPSRYMRDKWVTNIITTYASASDDQRQRGHAWYRNARDLAAFISDGDTRAGAGVIAALSANKGWAENRRLALHAFSTGAPIGHTGTNLDKAAAIMAGTDPSVVLPMRLKTGQFFECIADPSHPFAVCVDRHAHDVMVGRAWGDADRGLSSGTRYDLVADAYRRAAARLGILPMDLQATVWVVWTEHLSGTGTRRVRPSDFE